MPLVPLQRSQSAVVPTISRSLGEGQDSTCVCVAAAGTEERPQLRAGQKAQGTFWGQRRAGWPSVPEDQQDRDQKPTLPGNWECSGSCQALGTEPQQLSGSSPALYVLKGRGQYL